MSFSKEVKEELSKQIATARHCQIAEIAAIISLCGRIIINEEDEYHIMIHTENLTVARKYYQLIKSAFMASIELSIRRNITLKKSRIYTLYIRDKIICRQILQAVKFIDEHEMIRENLSIVNNLVIQKLCCKRAFLRGAFLSSGSISDPEKTYHLEIVCATEAKAKQLQNIINVFKIEAKIVMRKKYFIVYLKEGAQIVELLNVMQAHVALMNLENIRILKEMRNCINRQVNCETANIQKTVRAASKQVEDIIYIQTNVGLGKLSEGLEEIARLRMEQPEASLKELGELLNPPIGKSGVNHRLRKLSIMADNLRKQKEEMIYGVKEDSN